MPDELRSAYAVLGLRPGASLNKVKRQFKTLVRRWHPDRFANDPHGKTEANDRLRVINNAYNTILRTGFGETIHQVRRDPEAAAPTTARAPRNEAQAPGSNGHRAGTAEPTPPPMPPLTREQIDALIDALKDQRRTKPIRDQILDDPWNRGLSLALVFAYLMVDAIQTWSHPWPRAAMRMLRPAMPPSSQVVASIIGSMLWTLPLLWVIWYADVFSKKIAWMFLAIFALFLPFFRVMLEL